MDQTTEPSKNDPADPPETGRHDRVGRLGKGPNPVLFELLYQPSYEKDRLHVLPRLIAVDAAHVVMLAERALVPPETAGKLLGWNRELAERLRAGEDLFGSPPSHRGLYFLYEGSYVEELGPEVGGAAHLARSRNDINATVYRMRLRDHLLALLDACTRELDTHLALAERQAETVMSGFTHLQPAQPSTFGHYLAAVASELTRGVESLADALDATGRCPMGAAAAFGTSFAIDRRRVAELLGFDSVVESSLDAVASRDDAVAALSAAARIGVTLGRLATDLQGWGSHAYRFLDWPDDLVSTSSIMPQKRNAYVFENVRGRAVAPAGALTHFLIAQKNTPFTNAIEAGTESLAPLWPALGSVESAVRLTDLLLGHLETRPERMKSFLDRAATTMTAVADYLVAEHGVAFRTAHHVVGRLVTRHGDGADLTPDVLGAELERLAAEEGVRLQVDGEAAARALESERCVERARHGGGPAPEGVREQLEGLRDRHRSLQARLESHRRRRVEAEAALAEARRAIADDPAGAVEAAAKRAEEPSAAAPAIGGGTFAGPPASSVLDLMRESPLVRLQGRAVARPRARLWGKLELALPGSMKDRVALNVVERAEREGRLAPGGVIVESSSGSMAEGLARVGTLKGYRVIIVTDPRIDDMTRAKLTSLGATLDVVDTFHEKGGWQTSRLERLGEVLATEPGAFWACQYDNPDNAGAYGTRMAKELIGKLGTDVGAVVASVGSGGSLCGTGRALKEHLPGVKVVAVDSVGSVLFHQPEGKRRQSGHGNSLIPGNVAHEVVDEVHWVADGECFSACRELARREGIFGGGSSGACYLVASWVAEQLDPSQHVVAIFPDRGDRYTSTIYSDDYFAQEGLEDGDAGREPERIRYAVDVAERWSCATVPHDGSVGYVDPDVRTARQIAAEVGLS